MPRALIPSVRYNELVAPMARWGLHAACPLDIGLGALGLAAWLRKK